MREGEPTRPQKIRRSNVGPRSSSTHQNYPMELITILSFSPSSLNFSGVQAASKQISNRHRWIPQTSVVVQASLASLRPPSRATRHRPGVDYGNNEILASNHRITRSYLQSDAEILTSASES